MREFNKEKGSVFYQITSEDLIFKESIDNHFPRPLEPTKWNTRNLPNSREASNV